MGYLCWTRDVWITLYPEALAAKDVNARTGREAQPLPSGAKDSASPLGLIKSSPEELASATEASRAIGGHEEFRRSIYGGERGTLGVPGGIDRGIASQE